MKLKTKIQVIKNKFIIQRFMVYSMVMCFIMVAAIFGVTKITSDYQSLNESNGQNNSVTVATDSAITVTATATPNLTPTPTPDPRTQVNVTVNFSTELISVKAGSKGSTRFYISQDKQKSWELMDKTQDIDLTIFMKSSDNYIYFKGDKDEKVVEVKIPKPDNSLKVSYVAEPNTGKLVFTNALGKGLQYRKGVEGSWITFLGYLDLREFEINGYTLQFRVMASTSTPAGKVVSVKIPKRQAPPTIKEDYSKFTLSGMKVGVTQYRLAGSSTWIDFKPTDPKVKTLDLTALLLPGSSPNVKPIPVGTIEFRNIGTDKKVVSGTRVVQTLAQPIAPVTSNVKLIKNSLTFLDATKDKPYEYIVLHKNETVNLQTAKWKKVTNSKEIIITKVGTASPVPEDVIYYRLAITKDPLTKAITPASMYGSVKITDIIIPQN